MTARARFLGLDDHFGNFTEAAPDLGVQGKCGLDGGLGVKFGREGDLEEDVLHHVAAERPREPDFPTVADNVAKASPGVR